MLVFMRFLWCLVMLITTQRGPTNVVSVWRVELLGLVCVREGARFGLSVIAEFNMYVCFAHWSTKSQL